MWPLKPGKAEEKAVKMATKVKKSGGGDLSELELSISNELVNLEVGSSELKTDLASLYINAAKEIDIDAGYHLITHLLTYLLAHSLTYLLTNSLPSRKKSDIIVCSV